LLQRFRQIDKCYKVATYASSLKKMIDISTNKRDLSSNCYIHFKNVNNIAKSVQFQYFSSNVTLIFFQNANLCSNQQKHIIFEFINIKITTQETAKTQRHQQRSKTRDKLIRNQTDPAK